MKRASFLPGNALAFRLFRSLPVGCFLIPITAVAQEVASTETEQKEPRGESDSVSGRAGKLEKDNTPLGSAFLDPIGFALMGPRLGVELGSPHITAALYGRWFSAGLVSRALFLDKGDVFGFSYGAGLRGRYYFGDRQDAAHVGLSLEYLHSRIENNAQRVVTVQSYLVPYVEGGYRFAWSFFYVDPSAGIGYAKQLSGTVENMPGGTLAGLFQPQDKSSVYGTLSVDVGVYF